MTTIKCSAVVTRRMIVACAAFLAATSGAFAQKAPASAAEPAENQKKEEVITLSVFEVASTQGKGYTVTNAATGFKTNESLLKIPQAVTVLTRDLIDDIGAVDSSNILQYAGVLNFSSGGK